LLGLYVVHLEEILDTISYLNKRIGELERRSQAILADSRGVLLLTIPQVGPVTAAEYMAEIGFQISNLTSASAIVKLGGTNPVLKQSGDHRGLITKISRQGIVHLRCLTYMLGKNLLEGRGNPYFKAFGQRLKLLPKQKRIAVGNKAHHIAFAMLKKGEIFAPKTWQGPPLADNPLKKLLPEFRDTASQQLKNLGIDRY